MGDVIISCNGIKKNYGRHEVLKGIDLEIQKGEIYGIVGKNGCGKTTLFKVLLGLSDHNGGEMIIGDDPNDIEKGRRHIGFFIGSNIFPHMTARQNLEYYRQVKGIKDKNEVERVLKLVEMDKKNTKVGGFSLGQRQRIGIANALMGNPDIIILDEPVNGLDPKGIADIRNLIKKLNEEYGITILISSHILSELQNTAHKFAVIHEGVVARVISQEDLEKTDSSVTISVSDLDKAKTALTNAGVDILSEKHDTKSLEDYYFELIGGKNA